jgi:hypothetical protein
MNSLTEFCLLNSISNKLVALNSNPQAESSKLNLYKIEMNINQNLYSIFNKTNLGSNLYSVVEKPISLIEKLLNRSVLKRFFAESPKVNLFSINL